VKLGDQRGEGIRVIKGCWCEGREEQGNDNGGGYMVLKGGENERQGRQ